MEDPEIKVKVLEMPPVNPAWLFAFLVLYTVVLTLTR